MKGRRFMAALLSPQMSVQTSWPCASETSPSTATCSPLEVRPAGSPPGRGAPLSGRWARHPEPGDRVAVSPRQWREQTSWPRGPAGVRWLCPSSSLPTPLLRPPPPSPPHRPWGPRQVSPASCLTASLPAEHLPGAKSELLLWLLPPLLTAALSSPAPREPQTHLTCPLPHQPDHPKEDAADGGAACAHPSLTQPGGFPRLGQGQPVPQASDPSEIARCSWSRDPAPLLVWILWGLVSAHWQSLPYLHYLSLLAWLET